MSTAIPLQPRPFMTVDVFTAEPYRGNPVTVVLDGRGLDDAQMQNFARWANLSETTFVLPQRTRAVLKFDLTLGLGARLRRTDTATVVKGRVRNAASSAAEYAATGHTGEPGCSATASTFIQIS